MIKAERLKELIEKEAMIYFYFYVNGKRFIRNLKLKSSFKSEFILQNLMITENDLFETKLEAEHYAKYGDIEETVKMPVPLNFEEVNKLIDNKLGFIEIYNNGKFCLSIVKKQVDSNIVTLYIPKTDFALIDCQFTEDNYTKALDKMVELWREEV